MCAGASEMACKIVRTVGQNADLAEFIITKIDLVEV